MAERRSRGAIVVRFFIVSALTVPALVAWGCGSASDSTFGSGTGNGDDSGPTQNLALGDGGDLNTQDSGCTGLQCKRVHCPDGGTTSLSGVVVSPRAGDPDPIYNAVVYVPNAPVEPFTDGVSCDRCGAPTSGSPIAVAQTGIDGRFTLTDVPVVDNLPLVVQLGRWRRQVVVSTVTACTDTALPSDLVRFPRNHSEGDIPRMALKSGDSDSPECVLRKMGIDESEFTAPDGGGRIEVYGGILNNPPTTDGGNPSAAALLDDLNRMKRYDIVMLPCDGNTFAPTTASMQNLEAFANLGGRIFASHYSYEWLMNAPAPSQWSGVVNWTPAAPPAPGTIEPGYINTTFPKGLAMSQWLERLSASDGGVIPTLWQPRYDVNAVNNDTVEWIAIKTPNKVGHFSFNTPLGADAGEQCGRVVFNDFHTVDVYGGQTGVFPAECGNKTQPLTPQERVFEFMLFDLSSCVQKDDLPPVPPPPVVK
mgnify:CR=1 FL=1